MIEQSDRSFCSAGWIELRCRRDDSIAVGSKNFTSSQSAVSGVGCPWLTMDLGIITSDVVVARTTIDPVAAVAAIGDSISADEVVVTRFPENPVESLPANHNVVTFTCDNQVVAVRIMLMLLIMLVVLGRGRGECKGGGGGVQWEQTQINPAENQAVVAKD